MSSADAVVAFESGVSDAEVAASKAAIEGTFGIKVDASGRISFHGPPFWIVEITCVAKGLAQGLGAGAGAYLWKVLFERLRGARETQTKPGLVTVRTEAGTYTVPSNASDDVIDSLGARVNAGMAGTYEWQDPPGKWVRSSD